MYLIKQLILINVGKFKRNKSCLRFSYLFFIFIGTISIQTLADSTQSESDKYCGYLQTMQAQSTQATEKPTPLDDIISFVNSLMRKVSLETIENEAIQKKMSFEKFQIWAKTDHHIEVSNHYKPKYLQKFIKEICGEITNSATFGAEQEPELSVTAEKQFDPTGHPYAPPASQSINQGQIIKPSQK